MSIAVWGWVSGVERSVTREPNIRDLTSGTRPNWSPYGTATAKPGSQSGADLAQPATGGFLDGWLSHLLLWPALIALGAWGGGGGAPVFAYPLGYSFWLSLHAST